MRPSKPLSQISRRAAATFLLAAAAVVSPSRQAEADDEKTYPGAAAVVVHDPVGVVALGGTVAYDAVNGRVRNSSTVSWLSVGVSIMRDVFAVPTELQSASVWVYDPSAAYNVTCEIRAVWQSGAVQDSELRTSVGSTGPQKLTFTQMSSNTDLLLHCDLPPAINGTVGGQSGVISVRWVEEE